MDFWDLAKLLLRRWYITIPLLALAVVLTVNVAITAKPDYVATTHIQLIPPPALPDSTKPVTKVPSNPWLDLGLGALTQTAALAIDGKPVHDGLKASGLSDTFTVTAADQQPTVTIEVVGKTAEQATATLDQLSTFYDLRINELQKQQNASSQLIIKTFRIKVGDTLTTDNAKVMRAAVIVGAVGLLLTLALTIAVDALLRRARARRSSDLAAAAPPASMPPPPSGMGLGAGRPTYGALPAVSLGADATQVLPAAIPALSGDSAPLEVTYQAADDQGSSAADLDTKPRTDARDDVLAEDETIVLPLSSAHLGRNSRR